MDADSAEITFTEEIVRLVPEALDARSRAMQTTGLNEHDVTNRALIFYDFIEQERKEGAHLVLLRMDGSKQRVEFL